MKIASAITLLFLALCCQAETYVISGNQTVRSNQVVVGTSTAAWTMSPIIEAQSGFIGSLLNATNLPFTGLNSTARTTVTNVALGVVQGYVLKGNRVTFTTNSGAITISADQQATQTNATSYSTFTVASASGSNTIFTPLSFVAISFTNNNAGSINTRGVFTNLNGLTGTSAIYTNGNYSWMYYTGDWEVWSNAHGAKLYYTHDTDPRADSWAIEDGNSPAPVFGGRTNATAAPVLQVTGAALAGDGSRLTNIDLSTVANKMTNYNGIVSNSVTIAGTSNTIFTPTTSASTYYITNSEWGDSGMKGLYSLSSGTHGTTTANYTNALYKVFYSSGAGEWQFAELADLGTILYYVSGTTFIGIGSWSVREGSGIAIPVFTGMTNAGSSTLVVSGAPMTFDGAMVTNIPSTSITGGVTTNLTFLRNAATTNTMYFTNGILMRVGP